MVARASVWESKHGNTLHAISFLRACQDNQFLVILSPSFVTGNNIDLGLDIFGDIFFVANLVMKGEEARCQRLETVTDVDLWPTRNAYVEVREVENNKVFYEAESPFSGRSYTGGIGTFRASMIL